MAQKYEYTRRKNFKPGKVSEASKIVTDRIKFKKTLKRHRIGEAAFNVLLVADRLHQDKQGLFTVTDVMEAMNKKRAVSEMHLVSLVNSGLLERAILGNIHKRTQFAVTKAGFALIKKGGKLFFSTPIVPASPALSASGAIQTKDISQADAFTGLTFTPLDL